MKNCVSILILSVFVLNLNFAHAQTGIKDDGSNPDNSSVLDIKSSFMGLLPPRMSTVQRDAISNPVEGLVIYNTNTRILELFNGTTWGPATGKFAGGSSQITDDDGNVYSTVQIGFQIWMASNLNLGTRIDGINNPTNNSIIEKYCYHDSEDSCAKYGGLYSWDEMMQYVTANGIQGICPAGWHLPTDKDWCMLEQEVDPTVTCSSTGWRGNNGGAKLKQGGSSGFNALLSGLRNTDGSFGAGGYYWTSSIGTAGAWDRNIDQNYSTIGRLDEDKTKGMSVRCLKYSATPPKVITDTASNITPGSAEVAGEIIGRGKTSINRYGHCWSKYPNPTVQFELTDLGATDTIGTFTSSLTSLELSTTYYVKAYAENSEGISYSQEISFTTASSGGNVPCPGVPTVTYGGQVYNTIKIGDQCWLKENLNIGTKIDGPIDQTNNSIIEKYCVFNDTTKCDIYGGLYLWNETMQYVTTEGVQGICPPGWHIPTDTEWCTLENYVDAGTISCSSSGYRGIDAGGNIKEAGFTHWFAPNTSATDASGFTALPAGYRVPGFGDFTHYRYLTVFWTSSQVTSGAQSRHINYAEATIGRYEWGEEYGSSVRCMKDGNPVNLAPATPYNPEPINGATNIAIDTTLAWTCTDPDGDALTYNVYFGTATDPPLVASDLTTATYDPGTMNFDIPYYWKIVATDIYGLSTIGNIWSFTTEDGNNPPATPTNPEPQDMATDISIDTILAWSCSDPNGDPLVYSIYFGLAADPPLIVSSHPDTSYDPGTLDYDSTYYWKIVATDDHDDSTASSIWSFTIEHFNNPPGTPDNPHPHNGATDISIDTILAWSCEDQDGDALTYSIYFGKTLNPPLIATNHTDTTYDPGTLEYDSLYFWKIVATDIYNDSTAGSRWSFITEEDPAWYCGDTLIDPRDSKSYATVEIGTQCWFSDNLDIGTRINGSQSPSDPNNIEKYCYDDEPDSCIVYGGLYLWDEMMQNVTDTLNQGICPAGWHLPTESEWCTLEQEVDPTVVCSVTGWQGTDVGTKLKQGGSSGFEALLGGYRSTNFSAGFDQLGTLGVFWTSNEDSGTDAWIRYVQGTSALVYRGTNDKTAGFSVRCLKDVLAPPTVTTGASSNIGIDTADVAGEITNTGWTTITQYGHCWSTSSNPTINDDLTDLGTSDTIGIFTSDLNGLNSSTTYYVKAYAENSEGVAYGTEISFTTEFDFSCPGIPTVTYDGKVYNTVLVGPQCWLRENLNIGNRINGSVPQANNPLIEKYCYDNLESNCAIYGGMYQWDEMMAYSTTPGAQGICPAGWHIPTDEEWKILEGNVDNTYGVGDPEWDEVGWRGDDAGGNLKETDTIHWNFPNYGATNSSGFTGLPGGYYKFGNTTFYYLNEYSYIWTSKDDAGGYFGSTYAWFRGPRYEWATVYRHGNQLKANGLYVRCLKN